MAKPSKRVVWTVTLAAHAAATGAGYLRGRSVRSGRNVNALPDTAIAAAAGTVAVASMIGASRAKPPPEGDSWNIAAAMPTDQSPSDNQPASVDESSSRWIYLGVTSLGASLTAAYKGGRAAALARTPRK